jgi:alpha-glucoside transport system permease protein
MAITLPATLIPLAFAAFAAYAFAWMEFPFRKGLFVFVVGLLVVPLQMSLVPLLQLSTGGAHISAFGETFTVFPDLDLAGKPAAVWLTHIAFGMPLAIFLLHNYISGLPADLMEAARIDGADHPTIFWRLVLPLSVPALAAFAIFQFLWVWNDYLVASTFLGTSPESSPMTVRLATLSGSRGQDWHLLTAAAFVSIALPVAVFFGLQRYFVRGLLAGSVKG